MEDTIARLQQQLKDEQRRREDADKRVLQVQRLRAEEQQQREDADKRVLQEQRLRAEEQQRREAAESVSQSQVLYQYLHACHELNLALEIITDRTLTTQGDTTTPAGRYYPVQILPWDDFFQKQEAIWESVMCCKRFCSAPLFASRNQLEYVRASLSPVSSEDELRTFERETVENAVVRLVEQAYHDADAQQKLRLQGTVIWQSHTNLGEQTVSESVAQLRPQTPEPSRAQQKSRWMGSHADQFCIYYKTATGQAVPTLAIEYKPPHKLSEHEIVRGLQSIITPADDVINQSGEGIDFASKRLATAVVTQLFASMIGKDVQYGYVCTGEVFVFLYIPDDPTIVYYQVCVPAKDVQDDDKDRLHYTAVAQVFAFTLQSLRASPPPQSWHDTAVRSLKTWDVEYIDVLKDIPPSIRKQIRASPSPYKPPRNSWNFKRSPVRTRSFCKQLQQDHQDDEDDEDQDGDGDAQVRPSAGRRRSQTGALSLDPSQRGNQDAHGSGQRQDDPRKEQSIQDRPYCTQKCLLGVIRRGPIDEDCPNSLVHGREHISSSKFLSLLRKQLAQDRGPGADCAPLYIRGSRGALFKVRLSSHGYTLVAKGMHDRNLPYLQHEHALYSRAQAIQGKHLPVCLGLLSLILPYYYDGGEYRAFLLLSWAGRPLFDCLQQIDKALIITQAREALAEMHRMRIIHGDVEVRNILYDVSRGTVMIVDLERAEWVGRAVLGVSDANEGRRGEDWEGGKKKDPFERELRAIVAHVEQCINA